MNTTTTAANATVTPEQTAYYRENGFVRVRNILTNDEAARFAGRVMEIVNDRGDNIAKGKKNQIFTQIVNIWREDDVMAGLARHPAVAAAAKKLAGVPLRLWHDQILVKDPHNNAPTEFHQDQPYWPHAHSTEPISIWVALEDVPVERGCMTFIPGSHRRNDLTIQALSDKRSMFNLCPDLEWDQRITVPLRAGDCTFHHGRCAHMANANDTDRHRVACAAIFIEQDATFDGRGHICTDDLELEVGKPFPDDRFPPI